MREDTKALKQLYVDTNRKIMNWKRSVERYKTLESFIEAMYDYKYFLNICWANVKPITKKHYEIRKTAYYLMDESLNEKNAIRIFNKHNKR